MTATALRRVALAAIAVAGGAAAAWFAQSRQAPANRPLGAAADVRPIAALTPDRPVLIFRSTRGDETFRHVGYVPLDAADGPRFMTPLECDRLYFQHDRGVCLTTDHSSFQPFRAALFDAALHTRGSLRLSGPPSRTRVAGNGKIAAVTVFESGHSYADGEMSTRTSLVDLERHAVITDLEQFEVEKDGGPFKSQDFNFWGVTFTADGGAFYATLMSKGTIYLVQGNIPDRTARVIRSGVECPSLSPDGRRIAFKKRTTFDSAIGWQVAVLDLATSHETVLTAEIRSVDDQVEWLDDERIMYHQPTGRGADIWVLGIDNAHPPRILLPDAYSPVVYRP